MLHLSRIASKECRWLRAFPWMTPFQLGNSIILYGLLPSVRLFIQELSHETSQIHGRFQSPYTLLVESYLRARVRLMEHHISCKVSDSWFPTADRSLFVSLWWKRYETMSYYVSYLLHLLRCLKSQTTFL